MTTSFCGGSRTGGGGGITGIGVMAELHLASMLPEEASASGAGEPLPSDALLGDAFALGVPAISVKVFALAGEISSDMALGEPGSWTCFGVSCANPMRVERVDSSGSSLASSDCALLGDEEPKWAKLFLVDAHAARIPPGVAKTPSSRQAASTGIAAAARPSKGPTKSPAQKQSGATHDVAPRMSRFRRDHSNSHRTCLQSL
mmetsp:Transcript_178279/g.571504  ORF Transcript_178279/g.571504 Transcript_178279/m.571504 type:complete len:202 (-) Transcript_178279:905-1510(-)